MRYRVKPGFAAWLLMRASGVGLTVYLVLHVWVLSRLARGPEAWGRLMATLESPAARLLEAALAAGLIFHAVNGVRLLLVDFADGHTYQRRLFWLASAAAAGGAGGLLIWNLCSGAL